MPLLQPPTAISSVLAQPPLIVSLLPSSCIQPSPSTNTTGSNFLLWQHSILDTKHYFSYPFLPQKPPQNSLASNKTVIFSRLCSLSWTQLGISSDLTWGHSCHCRHVKIHLGLATREGFTHMSGTSAGVAGIAGAQLGISVSVVSREG